MHCPQKERISYPMQVCFMFYTGEHRIPHFSAPGRAITILISYHEGPSQNPLLTIMKVHHSPHYSPSGRTTTILHSHHQKGPPHFPLLTTKKDHHSPHPSPHGRTTLVLTSNTRKDHHSPHFSPPSDDQKSFHNHTSGGAITKRESLSDL